MTDKNKLYATEISNFLSNKDYDSIFSLFNSTNYTPAELKIFYKRNKKILTDQNYWISKLPHFYLKEIVEGDFKIEFLQGYFFNNDNCNDEFNKHLTINAKEDFIKFIKLWGVFNKQNFFNSLTVLAKTDSEIERFVKELEIVIKAQERINGQALLAHKELLKYTFGEIVMSFICYLQNYKGSLNSFGNRKNLVATEMQLVNELNGIIKLFEGKDNMTFEINQESLLNFHLIDEMIERARQKNIIELYLSGYADFQSVIIIAPLLTNKNHRNFRINDAKSEPEEFYFFEFNIEYAQLSKTDISHSIKFWNFYKLPLRLKMSNDNDYVDMLKVFKLLKHFTVEIQYDNIRVFEYDKLILSISESFKWHVGEVQLILSFLTFDLLSSKYPGYWIDRPFFRSANKVFWIGPFLRDRRWEIVFLNRIKFEPEKNFKTENGKYMKQEIAQNFEKKIEELFKSSGFKTISSLRFKSANEQKGDFDVLAFKDNHLIVCEAKTGLRTDEFVHASKTEAMRLEGKAADQLIKAIHNIKEDWSNLKTKLKLSASLKIEDIEIIPLIITDNFEGDLRLYKKTILKTSLLELEVNLKNKKRELLELYLMEQPDMNSLNKDFKDNNMNSINWDLWNGENECSVKNLIKNIEENAIWKELETVWKFENLSLSLDY
jgi:Holliday junction resolvase